MRLSDEAMLKLCDAMRSEAGAGVEFELALGELIGKYRHAHERRMLDSQAAELLPKVKADVVAIRQGCHRSTVYRRVSRAQKVARQKHGATESA